MSAAYDPHYRSLVDFAMANLLYLSMSLLLWGMEAFAFLLLATHTFFGASSGQPAVLVCLVVPSTLTNASRIPANAALANLTSYECAKGPERVWYLRGVTRDVCDLPFSTVRRAGSKHPFPVGIVTPARSPPRFRLHIHRTGLGREPAVLLLPDGRRVGCAGGGAVAAAALGAAAHRAGLDGRVCASMAQCLLAVLLTD